MLAFVWEAAADLTLLKLAPEVFIIGARIQLIQLLLGLFDPSLGPPVMTP